MVVVVSDLLLLHSLSSFCCSYYDPFIRVTFFTWKPYQCEQWTMSTGDDWLPSMSPTIGSKNSYGMSKHDGIETTMILCSIFSCLASLFMVFSHVIMRHVRNKLYMKVILFVAISNGLSAFGTIIGAQKAGTPACFFQALMTHASGLSSALWILNLMNLLYNIVHSKSVFKIDLFSSWRSRLIWCFSITVSFLPLVITKVNTCSPMTPMERGWCVIVSKENSNSSPLVTVVWTVFSFYFWIWLSVVLSCVLIYHIMLKIRLEKSPTLKAKLRLQFAKCCPYPFIVAISWTLPAVVSIRRAVRSTHDTISSSQTSTSTGEEALNILATLLPCLMGFFNACIFIWSNFEVLSITWCDFLSLCLWKLRGRKIEIDSMARVMNYSTHAPERLPAGEAEFVYGDICYFGEPRESGESSHIYHPHSNSRRQQPHRGGEDGRSKLSTERRWSILRMGRIPRRSRSSIYPFNEERVIIDSLELEANAVSVRSAHPAGAAGPVAVALTTASEAIAAGAIAADVANAAANNNNSNSNRFMLRGASVGGVSALASRARTVLMGAMGFGGVGGSGGS